VSISGSTVATGAYLAKVGVNRFQGAAYVFVKPVNGWANMTESAKLTASDGQEGNEFAYSLAISGNTLVVGSSNNPSASAAYVFVKPTTGWATTSQFKARLTASDGSIFGFSVAISGRTLVSGAIGNNQLQGAAYVFGR
jgi:FG-GAP repeat